MTSDGRPLACTENYLLYNKNIENPSLFSWSLLFLEEGVRQIIQGRSQEDFSLCRHKCSSASPHVFSEPEKEWQGNKKKQ